MAYVHLKRSLSHLGAVVLLTCSINARCGLFQASIFFDCCSVPLKALFYLFRFLDDFFATWTALLQILFAETFDLRRAGTRVHLNFITQSLQLLREVHSVDGRCVSLAAI